MSEDKRNNGGGTSTGIIVKAKPKTKKPSMYKVLMLNDDYTPMEFVVHVLEQFFSKNREEATRIMLHVHQRGVGVCGVFTYEVAETKVTQVIDYARQHQHPLQGTLEKE
jgi:ATP-dependent Clp protease adaptor protein ClpS